MDSLIALSQVAQTNQQFVDQLVAQHSGSGAELNKTAMWLAWIGCGERPFSCSVFLKQYGWKLNGAL